MYMFTTYVVCGQEQIRDKDSAKILKINANKNYN